MHRSNSQSGQTLLLVMIAIVPICLVVGLVVDVGMAYFTKTSARAAAQTAALAAVQAAIDGFSSNSDWTAYTCGDGPACQSPPASCAESLAGNLQSACDYAEANGFTGSNILVQAGNGVPPGFATTTSVNYWVRVQITQQNPLTFGIFSGLKKLNVSASAVAAAANMMPLNCLVALTGGMNLTGNPTVSISGCGIGVDADLSATGSVDVQAPWTQVVGYTQKGNVTISPSPVTVSQVPDPLKGVPSPQAPNDCTHAAPVTSGGTTTYSPGEYCGGISAGANENVIFKAGMYYLKGGGLSANGTASLWGQNVTFYNTCNPSPCSGSSDPAFEPITMTGNASMNLSAPITATDAANSGAMQGILFFEDRNAPAATNDIHGNPDLTLTGAIYFPQNALTFYGNPAVSSRQLMIVANSVGMTGDVSLTLNPQSTSGPPITPQISAALIQ